MGFLLSIVGDKMKEKIFKQKVETENERRDFELHTKQRIILAEV